MKFHEKLQTLRKNAGMTQSDLAERLNVSRQAVSRWEMGAAMPDIENLIAMSDVFGVTLDQLLKDENPEIDAAPAENADIQIPEPVCPEPESAAPKKKQSNRIWWIIWAAAFSVSLAVAVVATLIDHYSHPYSFVTIHPMTLIAQVINMALILGILVFIIRWLCRKGK